MLVRNLRSLRLRALSFTQLAKVSTFDELKTDIYMKWALKKAGYT